MYFKVSFDQEFDDLMFHLFSKYGREMFTLDGIGDQMDLDKFAKSFFNTKTSLADSSVDSNSNVSGRSLIEWTHEFPKPLSRYNSYYLIWKELKRLYGRDDANKIIESQLNGDIYINDFSEVQKPYCFNYSTYDIHLNGLEMSKRMKIHPPKSLASFIRQTEQFIVYAANSTLGATGIADFLIVASKYFESIFEEGKDGNVKVNNPSQYIKELFTSFIYTMNWEYRASQSAFTNLSIFDSYFLKSLCPDYGADSRYVVIAQRLFIDCMNEELSRTALTFPIITACFTVDEERDIRDEGFKDYIAEANLKYGFLNIYMGETSQLSSCCRLRSDTSNEYFNSFGAGSTKIGSLGVVTLNLPRMAVRAEGSIEEAMFYLRRYTSYAIKINNAKRSLIKKRIAGGHAPLYKLGYMDINKQYSTVGFNGLNEFVEILGMSILDERGQKLARCVLEEINKLNDDSQKQYKAPHNAEQTPSEGSAVKLAQKDTMLGLNPNNYPLYSNQFIPLTTEADILTRLDLQGMFDGLCSGGAICHVNIGESIKDAKVMADLMDYAAKAGVIYWAINYVLKRCEDGHVWVDGEMCPFCGNEVDKVTTRVVGFFTDVENWNKTRRTEDFPNRVFKNA